jgi:peptide/nickel transport system ATP-binding protein
VSVAQPAATIDPAAARAEAGAPILEARGVARHFDVSAPWLERVLARRGRTVLRAVDGVDVALREGETFGLVGESGCGKSTLARLIVGLYAPTRGTIHYDGRLVASPGVASHDRPGRRGMQMIFQDPYASLNPHWRVAEVVAEPLHALASRIPAASVAARVEEVLVQVGLSAADARRYPHQFSGGQRQRISIARALAAAPRFLVCDEPTSALDVSVQAQVLNLMRDLQQRLHLTYLFISHNLAVVRHIADRVAVMYLGRIVESAPTETLFAAPRHPYTRMLLDAVPDLERTGMPRTAVAGEVPDPLDPPAGCAFHPRCPHAFARCRSEVPAPLPAGATLVACHAVSEGRIGALCSPVE